MYIRTTYIHIIYFLLIKVYACGVCVLTCGIPDLDTRMYTHHHIHQSHHQTG